MDSESSTKFIGSLTKFLQSLCNGYVEFDDGVELIGHIYLSVDAGKTGKTLNYFLNEKVCKNDNSVTFISNSFHAQPEAKSKASSGKDGETRKEDGDVSDSGDVPKSTNVGTILSRPQVSSRSGSSPNQNRTGTKRPGSPLKGPVPSQRRASTPPSQRRIQSSAARGTLGSPVSKTVPSSPSSSSQDNIPSPSPARKSRTEIGHPTSNQSENVNADTENDIVPPNVLSINPTAEFASFLGSLTSDNQTSQDQPSPPDTKPDTDVTFIKEEFVSEPSSCAQAGSSGQHSGRSGEDNSGLYPVMLHQNTSVFPSTSAGYHAYQGGASATATSQHPGFPGTSSSQSDPFNPVAGTSQDGADPSDMAEVVISGIKRLSEIESAAQQPEQSQQTVPLQPEVGSVSTQEALAGQSAPGRFLAPAPYPPSGHTDPVLRPVTQFHAATQSGSLTDPLPVSQLQAQQVSSASQLKTLLQSPLAGPSRAVFPQHAEVSLPVGQGFRTIHYSNPVVLHEPQPSSSSAHQLSQQQQQQQQCYSPLQRVSPSPSSASYAVFSQSQLTPPLGMAASSSQSPRSSPVDPAVHSSTPQFPPPQHRSPGRPRLWGEKKEYHCYECGKVFKSQQALGYHRNAKHGHREDLMCPLCGKMLSHKQHKNYHMKHVHGIDEFGMLSL
ncbi:uncharacterized protein LOC143299655 isoform X1 [Babylonia areolata]|uniref:uncharacterized protein LOC143299655 isoform X1 n=1 Tax=Babylonia areolata TaxID=304850 RepID=UPI003FD0034E